MKMMSSTVNGAPSDHLVPARRVTVKVRWSGDVEKLSAKSPTMLPSGATLASPPPRSTDSVRSETTPLTGASRVGKELSRI